MDMVANSFWQFEGQCQGDTPRLTMDNDGTMVVPLAGCDWSLTMHMESVLRQISPVIQNVKKPNRNCKFLQGKTMPM